MVLSNMCYKDLEVEGEYLYDNIILRIYGRFIVSWIISLSRRVSLRK